MVVKSTTQMTKKELIRLVRDKNIIIADLNEKIDSLELTSIASEAHPMDGKSSKFLASLLTRIRNLEKQLDNS